MVNFNNELSFPELLHSQQSQQANTQTYEPNKSSLLARTISSNGLLKSSFKEDVIKVNNNNNEVYFELDKNEHVTSGGHGIPADTTNQAEVYFTTELYSEAIHGIYQEKKAFNSCSFSNLLGGAKNKSKDKEKYSEYFRNLNYMEILNLIFLTDFKCYQTLQSSHALFLQKSNSIDNLYALLKLNISSSKHQQAGQLGENMYLSNLYIKDFVGDGLDTNVLNSIDSFNTSFYESIRILPDLSLIPKKQIAKSELVENHQPANLHRPILNEKPFSGRGRFLLKTQAKMSSQLQTNAAPKETTAGSQKKKKPDSIALCEQLKPVLDLMSDLRLPVTVNFQFNMRGVLFESALYINVFEDVPLSLFRNNLGNKASAAGFSQFHNQHSNQHHPHIKLNANELSSIQKIQQFFFMNIDEHLKKLDGFYLCNKQDKHGFKETPFNYDAMNKELKNALIFKLNDIKVRFQVAG